MKTYFLIIALALSFASCKNETVSETVQKPKKDHKEQPAVSSNEECYQWIKNKDTVDVQLVRTADNIRGTLRYMWFEKDKSNGTIVGVFKRDTLRADFKFQSEGMESLREVIFVRKGNQLIEGHGNMEDKNGKMVFTGKLDFSNSIAMTKIKCD